MKRVILKIKATFIQDVLGTASGNKEIHKEFIAAKSKDKEKIDEELAAIPEDERVEKCSTLFSRTPAGEVFMYDYHWKGFFKAAFETLVELGDIPGLTKWGIKKAVDNNIFPSPRCILFYNNGQPITQELATLERPIKAETMQGPRIALARSEVVPEGSTVTFEVLILTPDKTKDDDEVKVEAEAPADSKKSKKAPPKKAPKLVEAVKNALAYGALKGMLQWRNAGFGRFTHEIISVREE